MILIFAIAAFALLTLSAIVWATWLDYKTSMRVLEMVDAATRAGQSAPAEVLARLAAAEPAAAAPLTQRTLKWLALMLLAVGVFCFVAAAFVSTAQAEGILLQVAAISGITSLVCLSLKVFGRHLRL